MEEVIYGLRYYGGWVDKINGKTYPTNSDFTVITRKEPLGVVGLVAPWNYPLLMGAWKLFPALAAGNTIVFKPSEETPLSILRFCELIKEVGFPAGVWNVIPGYGNVAGEALARHPKVAKISFTGSTLVGRKILEASAQSNLKKVHLELGGKAPALIFDDANIGAIIPQIISAAFGNSG